MSKGIFIVRHWIWLQVATLDYSEAAAQSYLFSKISPENTSCGVFVLVKLHADCSE